MITSGDEPDGDVLAEAAVLSAAVSGAAAERAGNAEETAEEAAAAAETAQGTADVALQVAATSISEERAREIAREETEARLAALLAKAEQTTETPAASTETIDPAVMPPSVAKANDTEVVTGTGPRRGKWARMWEGS